MKRNAKFPVKVIGKKSVTFSQPSSKTHWILPVEILGRTVDSGRNPCSSPLRYFCVGIECSLLARSVDCACARGLNAAKCMSWSEEITHSFLSSSSNGFLLFPCPLLCGRNAHQRDISCSRPGHTHSSFQTCNEYQPFPVLIGFLSYFSPESSLVFS